MVVWMFKVACLNFYVFPKLPVHSKNKEESWKITNILKTKFAKLQVVKPNCLDRLFEDEYKQSVEQRN